MAVLLMQLLVNVVLQPVPVVMDCFVLRQLVHVLPVHHVQKPMVLLPMQLQDVVAALRRVVKVKITCFVPHLKIFVRLVHRVVKRLVFIQIVLHVNVVKDHVRLVVGCIAMQLSFTI